MNNKVAVHPLSWTNEVIIEFGENTPVETYLDDAVAAGYVGIELGRKVPRDPVLLRSLLEPRGLELVTGWYSSLLADRSVEEELKACHQHVSFLKDMSCKVLSYGECGSMAPKAPLDVPMSKRISLYDIDVKKYAEKITQFAKAIKDEYDITLAYHHHLMMIVEKPDELDALMDNVGEEVKLLFDTGHYIAGGGDLESVITKYGERIHHIHLKDVRAKTLADVRTNDLSFNQAVRDGIFAVPGDGCINYSCIAKFIKNTNYQGWLTVEAEQNPVKYLPLEVVTRARKKIREVFGI